MKTIKILCLHGKGTSAEIFKAQTVSFRQLMKDSIHLDFHFVDGPLNTSAAAGIDLFYGPPYYAFWEEENATETQAARAWLADLIAESGPFDGVMMFSQGCILGASMLLRHQIQNPHQPPPFKFAIFICGGAPLREMESLGYSIESNVWERDRLSKYALHYKAGLSAILSQGSARWTEVDTSITAEDLAEEITGPSGSCPIKVPSVHIYGSKDPRYYSGMQLANLFDKQTRRTYDHQGGHEIPRTEAISRKIMDLVNWAAISGVGYDG
ncbi:Serine hydrolase FSH [Elaphomyces granulatus]